MMIDEQQRAAALMQARVARANSGHVPYSNPNPAQEKRVRFVDRPEEPHQPQPQQPVPKPVQRIVPSSVMLPPKKETIVTAKENMEGTSESTEAGYTGLEFIVKMIILALLVSVIFVLPDGYKTFWITIVGLVLVSYLAFQLYYEWDKKAFLDSETEENQEKYKTWAIGMLYAINVTVTSVIVGILLVMVWKIYTMVRTRSNMTNQSEMSAPPPTPATSAMEYRPKRKKKKNRSIPFV